jgi:DNA-binding transcriptional LysR family regulator
VQQHFLGRERIERDLAALRQSGTGTLRIGCTPALGLSVLPAVVHAFVLQHPSTPISLQTLGTPHLREGLQLGQFDLVVSTMAIDAPDLNASVLHRSQAVCVMHPGHALAQRDALHVSDLADQLLLTLNADDNIFLQLQQTMQRHGVQARSTIETTYSSTICCLAAEGTGIGVVNPYVASKFAAELAIRPLLPQCAVEIALALPLHRAPSARADVFVELLQQQLHSQD